MLLPQVRGILGLDVSEEFNLLLIIIGINNSTSHLTVGCLWLLSNKVVKSSNAYKLSQYSTVRLNS